MSDFDLHKFYKKQYPFVEEICSWGLKEIFKIQRYKPMEGYFSLHCENDGEGENISKRCLAWMIYLNDVEEGGLTDFPFQEMTVKPQKGLMLIWPADFTHLHCGEPVEGGVKYIMTGWMGLPFYLPSAGSSVQLPKGITFSRSYC